MREGVLLAGELDVAIANFARLYDKYEKLGREIVNTPDALPQNMHGMVNYEGARRVAAALPPFVQKLFPGSLHDEMKKEPLAISEARHWNLAIEISPINMYRRRKRRRGCSWNHMRSNSSARSMARISRSSGPSSFVVMVEPRYRRYREFDSVLRIQYPTAKADLRSQSKSGRTSAARLPQAWQTNRAARTDSRSSSGMSRP
jgi:hypothetical protein